MDHHAVSAEEAWRRLEGVGVPLVRSVFARTPAEVEDAWATLGVEHVVVKSAGILHKTDVDGIALHLGSAVAARDAAEAMLRRLGPSALPFHVQEHRDGLEVLVGLRRDPNLGAVVVIGLGGVHTELLEDVARRVVPVTSDDAHEALRDLRTWPLFEGYRGTAPRDVDALCELVLLVSSLAEQDRTIQELDLNPVMVGAAGEGCVVVDARIIETSPPPARPRVHHDLTRMLRPRHIAVVGASDDDRKAGGRLFRYLVDHGFAGRLDPIHPAGGELRGRQRLRSLKEVEGSPDLVCVAVPSRHVLDIVHDALELKAGGILVHSSDFADAGEEGRQLQDQLTQLVNDANVPLAGPNAMGIVVPPQAVAASISGGLELPSLPSGSVALIASSGALGSCLASRLLSTGVGLSCWIHVGNEADVTMAEYLDWLVEDPETSAVGLVVEDVKDGPALIAAGRRMADAGKPVFVYNMVRTEQGRAAALSHTGALVGSFELREEVLRAAGMVRVPSLQALEDVMALSAAGPLPRGQRLLALCFSGGACSIIADEMDSWGIELPPLSPTTAELVSRHVASFAAVRNPMDVSFQMVGEVDAFRATLDVLLSSGEFDAVLVQFTTNADPFAADSARTVVEARAASEVPVYVSRYGADALAPRALEVYREAGVPVLDAPDRAAQAVAALMRAGRQLPSSVVAEGDVA